MLTLKNSFLLDLNFPYTSFFMTAVNWTSKRSPFVLFTLCSAWLLLGFCSLICLLQACTWMLSVSVCNHILTFLGRNMTFCSCLYWDTVSRTLFMPPGTESQVSIPLHLGLTIWFLPWNNFSYLTSLVMWWIMLS